MKKSLSETIKNIGFIRILLIFAAGIVLILCSVPFPEPERNELPEEEISLPVNCEQELELRLEQILGEMKGIRSVKVMITLENEGQRMINKDVTVTEEVLSKADEQGGTENEKRSEKKETTIPDQNERPYVIKESMPEIRGVLVMAEGELTPIISEQISGAVQALFQIEAHRVKVLEKKMSSEG